ncbi:MAG: hypothetical protein ACREQI_05245 [Candidatus Binataceae bacterium]
MSSEAERPAADFTWFSAANLLNFLNFHRSLDNRASKRSFVQRMSSDATIGTLPPTMASDGDGDSRDTKNTPNRA